MTEGNTFNVSREVWSDEAFRDEPFTERQAWLWLVGEASWKARKKRVGDFIVSLGRGQLAHSPRYMADAWDWSHGKVRRFLKRLEKLDKIDLETGTGVTIVTIGNYDKYQHGGTATGTGPAQDRHRTGTNEKTEERQKKDRKEESPAGLLSVIPTDGPTPADEVSAAVSGYNATAERSGWPKVQKLNPTRRKALTARMKEVGGIEGWNAALEKAEGSDFLCGRTNKPWTGFGFDWMTKAANFTKIMEGNYDNRPDQRSRDDATIKETIRRIRAGEIDRGPDPSDPFGGR